MHCNKCEKPLDSRRTTLGLKDCFKCSDVQKYSSHTVYPHKTGGYVQPISSEQSDNLKRLDRRSLSNNRPAKGIFKDNSWDRWLNNYYANIYKKQPTKRLSKKILKRFSHMETKSIYHIIVEEFMKFGYYRAQEKLNKLYDVDKISLVQKGKIMDNLSELKMMSSKELKFFKKLEQPKGKLDAK